jgi:hypothetical protein
MWPPHMLFYPTPYPGNPFGHPFMPLLPPPPPPPTPRRPLDADAHALRQSLLELLREPDALSAEAHERLALLRAASLAPVLTPAPDCEVAVILAPTALNLGTLAPASAEGAPAATAQWMVYVRSVWAWSVPVRLAVPPLGSNVVQYSLRLLGRPTMPAPRASLGTTAGAAHGYGRESVHEAILAPWEVLSVQITAYVGGERGACTPARLTRARVYVCMCVYVCV